MLADALAGYMLGLSLILAIGAQNAFVLRQGLRGTHVFSVSLTCALSDAVLIAVGVAGFSALNDALPGVEVLMRWGGAAFLLIYGARHLWSALRGGHSLDPADAAVARFWPVLLACLALTWLNPHVYLDTVVLLGTVAAQHDDRLAFGLGAVTASFTFFFALGYGARLLRPIFARPVAWRILDLLVGALMWSIAVSLLL